MDGRREPRFEIYVPAKLALLDSPERELECLLLDVSATGMKFVADESVAVDEVVVLEVEDHLVLSDVRYSQPRGEKFVIGAERIHAVEKAGLPEDKTRAEQIRFVVDDYRSRIRMAIAGETAPVKKQEPELPILHRDQVIEAAVQRLVEQWSTEPEGSGEEGTLRAAIVERAAEKVAERAPVLPPVTVPSVTAPPPVTTPLPVTAPPPVTTPPPVTAPPSVTTPPPVTTRPLFTTPPPATTPPPVTTRPLFTAPPPATARPLFTGPPPDIARPKRPSWRLPAAIVGVIAMVAFTGSLFWSYRNGVAANSSRPAAVASKTSPPQEPSPALADVKPALPPATAPAAATGTRHAEIRVTEPVWVYAVSDGKEVFQKLLAKDETRQLDFTEKALVRVGNAGGVEISVDGQSIGSLGPRGQIRALEITPDGHRFVPLSAADPEKN